MKAVKTNAERTRYTNAQTTAAKRGTSTNALAGLSAYEVTDYENTVAVLASLLGEDATLGQIAGLLRKRIGSCHATAKTVNITINL